MTLADRVERSRHAVEEWLHGLYHGTIEHPAFGRIEKEAEDAEDAFMLACFPDAFGIPSRCRTTPPNSSPTSARSSRPGSAGCGTGTRCSNGRASSTTSSVSDPNDVMTAGSGGTEVDSTRKFVFFGGKGRVGPMGGEETEACGRCAMSAVVDATTEDDEERDSRDPYGGGRSEMDERELRWVSPTAWIGATVERLDDLATRLAYGR
jgi:hypothetical protein